MNMIMARRPSNTGRGIRPLCGKKGTNRVTPVSNKSNGYVPFDFHVCDRLPTSAEREHNRSALIFGLRCTLTQSLATILSGMLGIIIISMLFF